MGHSELIEVIRLLLQLLLMLWGFYIILWAVNPKLKHPITVVTDNVKRAINGVFATAWGFITAILSFLFLRGRKTRKQSKRDQAAYEKALSITSLDSKVIKRPRPVTHILDSWNTYLEDVYIAPSEYYRMLQSTIEEKGLSEVHLKLIYSKQGGLLSNKRMYLRITRGRHVFDICVAPFGNGIFISWWLGISFSGLLGFIARRRFIGPLVVWVYGRFIKPPTYYRIDTARTFQKVILLAILDVHQELTGGESHDSFTDVDKPSLKELYP